MKVTRISMFSGRVKTREIDITEEQLAELEQPKRRFIQEIVPHLSAEDREFLLTGLTKEEWQVWLSPKGR